MNPVHVYGLARQQVLYSFLVKHLTSNQKVWGSNPHSGNSDFVLHPTLVTNEFYLSLNPDYCPDITKTHVYLTGVFIESVKSKFTVAGAR